MEMLWIILGAILLFSGPIAFAIAISQSNRLSALDSQVQTLTRKITILQKDREGTRISSKTNQAVDTNTNEGKDTPPQQAKTSASSPPKIIEETPKVTPVLPKKSASMHKSALKIEGPKKADLENDISSKWMIWLGGIALALGGAFIVKYSIEAGLLGPTARIMVGSLFGLVIVIAGELVRRHKQDIPWLKDAPNYISQALSGAGFFTLFSVILSAYSLYDMITPVTAFILLVAVSLSTTWFAVLQGKLFAYLGLVGGLIVPIIVSTGGGNAWTLFPYLLFIASASLGVARFKAWTDLVAASVGLSVLWVPLWMAFNWHAGDGLPVGLYALLLGACSVYFLRGATPERNTDKGLLAIWPIHPVSAISDTVIIFSSLMLVMIVRLEHYSPASLTLFAIALIGSGYIAKRWGEFDLSALILTSASFLLLSIWHVPDLIELQNIMGSNEAVHLAITPIAAPGFQTFFTACVLLAGGIGFAIFFSLPNTLRKPLWGVIGAAYPLLVLILAYARLKDFETSIPFSLIAMLMAGLLTFAVIKVRNQITETVNELVASYAAAASAAVALSFTMILRDAWLSTSLAVEVLALAYIWQKTSVDALRQLALLLASIVLVRLFLNASIFGYNGTQPLAAINWLFYGYALNAGIFWIAAKVFGQSENGDRLYAVLRAGAILLLVGFTTLELRVLFSETGSLLGDPSALEIALQMINWSAATTLLLWREIKDQDDVFYHLRLLMTAVALLSVVVGGGFANNIFFTGGDDFGAWPIFNVQLLQYFVPAMLFATKTYLCHQADKKSLSELYGAVALGLLLFWVTAEVRHIHTPHGVGPSSQWEIYSYSLVWLIFAAGLIATGLQLGIKKIRTAGLGLLGIVVVKVFLGDLSNLDGIARALSFIGLGGALIGLGFLYQRLQRS